MESMNDFAFGAVVALLCVDVVATLFSLSGLGKMKVYLFGISLLHFATVAASAFWIGVGGNVVVGVIGFYAIVMGVIYDVMAIWSKDAS